MNLNKKKDKESGFTLLELMIAVAIISILTSIAYPSYLKSVQKGKRSDAKVELLRVAQMQEGYFAQNMSYASSLTNLGLTTSHKSEQEEYSLAIKSTSPGGCAPNTATPCVAFVLETTAITASQLKDTDCKKFTLSSAGQKGINGGHAAADVRKCWK